MKFLIVFIILSISSNHLCAQLDSLQSYYDQSIAAYESEDFSSFLKYARLANQIRPNHPTLAYNHIAALVLNDKYDEAIEHLKTYVMMNGSNEFMYDPDFSKLLSHPGMSSVEELIHRSTEVIESSNMAIRISQDSIHFESIAAFGKTFYL